MITNNKICSERKYKDYVFLILRSRTFIGLAKQ